MSGEFVLFFSVSSSLTICSFHLIFQLLIMTIYSSEALALLRVSETFKALEFPSLVDGRSKGCLQTKKMTKEGIKNAFVETIREDPALQNLTTPEILKFEGFLCRDLMPLLRSDFSVYDDLEVFKLLKVKSNKSHSRSAQTKEEMKTEADDFRKNAKASVERIHEEVLKHHKEKLEVADEVAQKGVNASYAEMSALQKAVGSEEASSGNKIMWALLACLIATANNNFLIVTL